MRLFSGQIFFIVLISFTLIKCSSNTYDREAEVKRFYQSAKEREAELDIFFNVSFVARKVYNDGTFFIPKISYEFSESKVTTLPIVTRSKTKEDILTSAEYSKIKEFAELRKMTEDEVFNYTSRVVALADELKIGNVQSSPRLGKFIIFNISDTDVVVFTPDTSKVYHSYWKSFFRNEKKLDDKWYVKSNQTNLGL